MQGHGGQRPPRLQRGDSLAAQAGHEFKYLHFLRGKGSLAPGILRPDLRGGQRFHMRSAAPEVQRRPGTGRVRQHAAVRRVWLKCGRVRRFHAGPDAFAQRMPPHREAPRGELSVHAQETPAPAPLVPPACPAVLLMDGLGPGERIKMREGETVVAREHVAITALAPRREVPIPGLPAVIEREQERGAALFAAQRRDQHAPAASETDDKPGVVVQAGDVRGFRAAVRAPPALRPGADRERAGPHAGPEVVLRRVHAPQTAARGLHLAADGHDARQIVHAGDAGKAELVGGPEVAFAAFLQRDAGIAAQGQRGLDGCGRALDAVPGDGVAHQCGELRGRCRCFAKIDVQLPGQQFQFGLDQRLEAAAEVDEALQGRG